MIFDLDGTLLNTIGDLAAAANHTLAEMGFAPHTEEEYKYMVGNGIPKLIERFLPPGHRDKATQAQAARLFFPYYDAHKEDATAPYPGIPALLAALHGAGVKLGVVSNKEDALTKSVVSHYFPGLFDAVAGHTLGTPTKPDPHLVNGMRAAFGLSAQQVLYVGDSWMPKSSCSVRSMYLQELNFILLFTGGGEHNVDFIVQRPYFSRLAEGGPHSGTPVDAMGPLVTTASLGYKEQDRHVFQRLKELDALGLAAEYFDFDDSPARSFADYNAAVFFGR